MAFRKGEVAWNKGQTTSLEVRRKQSLAKIGKVAWNAGLKMGSKNTVAKTYSAMTQRMRLIPIEGECQFEGCSNPAAKRALNPEVEGQMDAVKGCRFSPNFEDYIVVCKSCFRTVITASSGIKKGDKKGPRTEASKRQQSETMKEVWKTEEYQSTWRGSLHEMHDEDAQEKRAASMREEWEENREERVAAAVVGGETRRERYGTTYAGVHQRMAYLESKGVLKKGTCSLAGCDKPAEDWALLKEAVQQKDVRTGFFFSLNTEDYVGMCRKCHCFYDRGGQKRWDRFFEKQRKQRDKERKELKKK